MIPRRSIIEASFDLRSLDNFVKDSEKIRHGLDFLLLTVGMWEAIALSLNFLFVVRSFFPRWLKHTCRKAQTASRDILNRDFVWFEVDVLDCVCRWNGCYSSLFTMWEHGAWTSVRNAVGKIGTCYLSQHAKFNYISSANACKMELWELMGKNGQS